MSTLAATQLAYQLLFTLVAAAHVVGLVGLLIMAFSVIKKTAWPKQYKYVALGLTVILVVPALAIVIYFYGVFFYWWGWLE